MSGGNFFAIGVAAFLLYLLMNGKLTKLFHFASFAQNAPSQTGIKAG